jgi:hypothetical protein
MNEEPGFAGLKRILKVRCGDDSAMNKFNLKSKLAK